jgi:hypothetical protein
MPMTSPLCGWRVCGTLGCEGSGPVIAGPGTSVVEVPAGGGAVPSRCVPWPVSGCAPGAAPDEGVADSAVGGVAGIGGVGAVCSTGGGVADSAVGGVAGVGGIGAVCWTGGGVADSAVGGVTGVGGTGAVCWTGGGVAD